MTTRSTFHHGETSALPRIRYAASWTVLPQLVVCDRDHDHGVPPKTEFGFTKFSGSRAVVWTLWLRGRPLPLDPTMLLCGGGDPAAATLLQLQSGSAGGGWEGGGGREGAPGC